MERKAVWIIRITITLILEFLIFKVIFLCQNSLNFFLIEEYKNEVEYFS